MECVHGFIVNNKNTPSLRNFKKSDSSQIADPVKKILVNYWESRHSRDNHMLGVWYNFQQLLAMDHHHLLEEKEQDYTISKEDIQVIAVMSADKKTH